MKLNLYEDYELTDNFFDEYKLDDVLLFSYAEVGANGSPGNISAVVKINDNEIGVYSGSYMWNNPNLSEDKVKEFFYLITMNNLDGTDWDNLNMGLGNSLFIRKKYSKEFRDKYFELIKDVPYILYSTWKYFAEYVLNKQFNNISDDKIIKTIDDEIDYILNDKHSLF